MGRGLSEGAERRGKAQTLCCVSEVPTPILVWGTESHCDPWRHQRSFSPFVSQHKAQPPPAFCLEPYPWGWPGNTFPVPLCWAVVTPALNNTVFVSSRKNRATQTRPFSFIFLKSKVVTAPSGFGGSEWTGGKLFTCIFPQTAASSVRLQVPPEEISTASRVSRGVKTPHLISKTHSNMDISFAAATNTLKNNRVWLLYDCHTHTQKKPTLPHVITPSEKTSCYGLCRASWALGIMREQNICHGSSNLSLPAQHYSKILKFTAKCYLEFLWHPEQP